MFVRFQVKGIITLGFIALHFLVGWAGVAGKEPQPSNHGASWMEAGLALNVGKLEEPGSFKFWSVIVSKYMNSLVYYGVLRMYKSHLIIYVYDTNSLIPLLQI